MGAGDLQQADLEQADPLATHTPSSAPSRAWTKPTTSPLEPAYPPPDLGCVYPLRPLLPSSVGLAWLVSLPHAGTRPLDSPRGQKGRNTWRRMAREMKAHERKGREGGRGDGDGRTEIAMAPRKANHLTCSLAPHQTTIHHTLCDPSHGGKVRHEGRGNPPRRDREGERREAHSGTWRARSRYRSARVFYWSLGIACAPHIARLNAYSLATWVARLLDWTARLPTGMLPLLARLLSVYGLGT